MQPEVLQWAAKDTQNFSRVFSVSAAPPLFLPPPEHLGSRQFLTSLHQATARSSTRHIVVKKKKKRKAPDHDSSASHLSSVWMIPSHLSKIPPRKNNKKKNKTPSSSRQLETESRSRGAYQLSARNGLSQRSLDSQQQQQSDGRKQQPSKKKKKPGRGTDMESAARLQDG